MTPKQNRFVEEFVIDQNPVEAYKRSGFKGLGNSASAAASRLLKNVNVKAAIEAKLLEKKAALEQAQAAATAGDFEKLPLAAKQAVVRLTSNRILEEAAAIAFFNINDVIDFSGPSPRLRSVNEVPERALRAVTSIKIKRFLDGADAREAELVELKFNDKNSAINILAKALDLYRPKPPLEVVLQLLHDLNPALSDGIRKRLLEGHRGQAAWPEGGTASAS